MAKRNATFCDICDLEIKEAEGIKKTQVGDDVWEETCERCRGRIKDVIQEIVKIAKHGNKR